MINFKAKHLTDRGFSQHLVGNGGEEELIIITSWGQDRKTPLIIASAQCDGGAAVLHTSGKRIILANVLAVIDRVMEKWAKGGIKPDAEQAMKLDGQRKKVLDRLAELYETGEMPKPEKKGKRKGKKSKEAQDEVNHFGH